MDIFFYFLDGCVPYSQEACKVAAENNSDLEIGSEYPFADGGYETKGCHYVDDPDHPFNGIVLYGTGGTENQRKQALSGFLKRPVGYDCN